MTPIKTLGAASPDKWKAGTFLTCNDPSRPISGRIYRCLGLRMMFRQSPKGRRPPLWTLFHLGTGHAICGFSLHEEAAIGLATEIAECADWDFDGLQGWRNVEPDLPDKFRAVRDAHPEAKFGNCSGRQSEGAARFIAEARAGNVA